MDIARSFERQYIANFDDVSKTVLSYDMKNAKTLVDKLTTEEDSCIRNLIKNNVPVLPNNPSNEYLLLVGLYYHDIDKLISKQYLEKCYLQNNATANIFLGLLETELGNIVKGHDYFMEGAKTCDICFGFCSEHTVLNYIWGDETRFNNAKITIEKLKNAVEKGCNRACYNLGFMFERYSEECHSHEEADKYYNMAITKNFNCYKSAGSLKAVLLWNEYLLKNSKINEEFSQKVENALNYLNMQSVRNFSYVSNIKIDIARCLCMLGKYDDSLTIYRGYRKYLKFNNSSFDYYQELSYIYCLIKNKEYYEAEQLCGTTNNGNAVLTLCNEYLNTNNHRKVNYICKHIGMLNKNVVNEWLKNAGYHYKIVY